MIRGETDDSLNLDIRGLLNGFRLGLVPPGGPDGNRFGATDASWIDSRSGQDPDAEQ
jgi:hypothetical protein